MATYICRDIIKMVGMQSTVFVTFSLALFNKTGATSIKCRQHLSIVSSCVTKSIYREEPCEGTTPKGALKLI